MNVDDKDRDLLKLNALVDGELPPAERAEAAARLAADRNFARGHATLARLKASIVETIEPDAGLSIPVSRADARRWRVAAYSATAAIFAGLCVAMWFVFQPHDPDPLARASKAEAVVLAAFPVRPLIPDFAPAGLKLDGVAYRKQSDGPLLVATYKGPRGCRLELHVRPSGLGAAVPAAADRKHQWGASGLSYTLVAFGMPDTRFAIVAGAAERQTRLNADPGIAERQLRQAGIAPPCIG